MKTYTLEEAEKITLTVLFEEACDEDSIVLVKGDQRVVISARPPAAVDDPYTEEEMAVFKAFEEESLRCSEQAAREMLAE